MNQHKKMEVFVASEDATRSLGLVDEIEVWKAHEVEGWTGVEGLGHLVLRGINTKLDLVLQAENECLRKDVEFYKNRSTVERELEMSEGEFGALLLGPGDLTMSEVAERLKISLVKPDPTEVDKIQELINGWTKATTFKSLAQHLADHGLKV